MKLHSKRNKKVDPVIARTNSLSLSHIVKSNLNLQSISRELVANFKVNPNKVNVEYLFSEDFVRNTFKIWDSEKRERFCRLVSGMRSKELLKELESYGN